MLKVLIVDDEHPARDELKFLLSKETGIQVVGEADSGPAAIELAANLKPQLIFLDVEMRGMNGCETALVIRSLLPGAIIVFATAYDEYAVRAFEIGAVDYILKPFEQDRIHAAIERIQNYKAEEWHRAVEKVGNVLVAKMLVAKLPAEKNGKITMINYSELLYAYAQTGTVSVVTALGEYHFNGTLTELEERLKQHLFMRVHKSYIVNLQKIVEVIPWFKGTYWLKVEGFPKTEIPVSKGQIKELKDVLGLK